MNAYSYHVFLFPFRWDFVRAEKKLEDLTFSDRTAMSQFVKLLASDRWEEFSEHENSPIEFYNDALFFYDSVRKSVFGNLNTSAHISQSQTAKEEFIVKNFASQNTGSLKYIINTKKYGCFDLDLEKIRLNVYSSGIGILSFYLANKKEETSDPESILRINDFGRRLFPTFLTIGTDENNSLLKEPQEDSSLPLEIKITEKGKPEPIFSENYDLFDQMKEFVKQKPNTLPNGSKNLLKDLLGENFTLEAFREESEEQIIIRPSLDDRMFAVCWFGNNSESQKLRWMSESREYGFQDYEKSAFWMRFLFMESGDSSAQSRFMRRGLTDRHTYHRWADKGTFYGVTRSTFVCLTDESDFAKDVIARHMRRLYAEMVQLALAQHTCTLRFSDEVGQLRKKGKEDLLKSGAIHFLYQRYLEFINHLYFRVVTPLEQGHELYQQLQSGLEIEPGIAKLDREVGEFTQLVSRLEEEERSRMNTWFSFLATILLPASVVAAVLGMSTLGDGFQFWGGSIHWDFLISALLALFASFVFWLPQRKIFNSSTIFPKKNADL